MKTAREILDHKLFVIGEGENYINVVEAMEEYKDQELSLLTEKYETDLYNAKLKILDEIRGNIVRQLNRNPHIKRNEGLEKMMLHQIELAEREINYLEKNRSKSPITTIEKKYNKLKEAFEELNEKHANLRWASTREREITKNNWLKEAGLKEQ